MSRTLTAVVVAYRSAELLPTLVTDLRAQGVEEIVVVDNASPDDAAAIASQLGARVVVSPTNGGFAAGVNLGLAACDADQVLLVNPDVTLQPDAVAALRATAARHPGCIIGPIVEDASGRLLPTRRSLPTLLAILGEELAIPERAPVGGWPQRLWARWQDYGAEVDAPILSGVCLLIPRSAWVAAGPMDERFFLYWEEVDWQLRARQAGHPTVLSPSAAVTHQRSTSMGLRSPARAMVLAASTRTFVRLHLPGWRGPASLGLLAAGQWLRWLVWSLPGMRGRDGAQARRVQHAAWLRGLRSSAS